MSENILFYFNWQLKPVHFGIVIEKLESILEEKKNMPGKVFFLFCNGILKPCYSNKTSDPDICSVCRFYSFAGLQRFKNSVEIIEVSQKSDVSNLVNLSYNTIEDIKKLKHKDVKIGYGALSSYISFTRNLDPLIDENFRSYFDKLLQSEIVLIENVLEIIQRDNITRCYFFNGRTADTRPLYDICLTNGINFVSLEMIKKSNNEYYINEFPNCLPHDVKFHHDRMMACWNDSTDVLEKKSEIGSAFFEKRRNNILVRDRKVYTLDQVNDLLPHGWNKSKKNVAIFISSEDEFVAIGDIFEKLAVFKTQETGILSILDKFKDDKGYDFVVRIHPNLKDVHFSYHKRIIELEKIYGNVTVIKADSQVSTYAIVDAADVIISFGSTVGVEACYAGKPVILLAGSFYYFLDAAYKPSNDEEVFHLLKTNLAPKPRVEALKYGYYMMNYEDYSRKNKLSPEDLKVFGKKIGLGHAHLKLLGSRTLFRLAERILKKIKPGNKQKRLTIPVLEK